MGTAATNFKLGDSSIWRKATILADCVVKLCEEPDDYTGRQLIDDEYLRERHGFDDADFVQYRFNPDVEPLRLLARPAGQALDSFKRGDVRAVETDIGKSGLDQQGVKKK